MLLPVSFSPFRYPLHMCSASKGGNTVTHCVCPKERSRKTKDLTIKLHAQAGVGIFRLDVNMRLGLANCLGSHLMEFLGWARNQLQFHLNCMHNTSSATSLAIVSCRFIKELVPMLAFCFLVKVTWRPKALDGPKWSHVSTICKW